MEHEDVKKMAEKLEKLGSTGRQIVGVAINTLAAYEAAKEAEHEQKSDSGGSGETA